MTKDETDTVVVSLYEEFKERKSHTGDLDLKQEGTAEEKSTEKKQEGDVKEQVEPGDSLKQESKDTTAIKSVDNIKKEPVQKMVEKPEKPKKKSSRKKKSAD